jgi:hypothetical protein
MRVGIEAENGAVALYLSGRSMQGTGRELGLHWTTVQRILRRRGVPRRSPHVTETNIRLRRRVFHEVNTEDTAYWLGMLFADGSVQERNRGHFSVSLGLIDEEHVEAFREFVGSDVAMLALPSRWPNGSTFHRVMFQCDEMATDLARHGCIPRKTHRTQWPDSVPEPLVHHFIRGYFDGDGSVYKTKQGKWGICFAGTPIFLSRLSEVISSAVGIPERRLASTYCKTKTIAYGGNRQVPQVLSYLYQGATISLERKRRRALQCWAECLQFTEVEQL